MTEKTKAIGDIHIKTIDNLNTKPRYRVIPSLFGLLEI